MRVRIFAIYVSILFLLCSGLTPASAALQEDTSRFNPDGIVYILNMGIVNGQTIQYGGLRNAFAIGNGEYILTAAHCIRQMENSSTNLRIPLVLSPYYGDIFQARVVASDQKNDIALLKVEWPGHPALQLEAGDKWKKQRKLNIAGYPPKAKERGGKGRLSRQIMSEAVRLRKTDGKGPDATQVGPVQYPGKGWSGSPFLNPDTGRVVGILSREKYLKKKFFQKQHHIYSGSHESILQLIDDNGLSHNADHPLYPTLDRKEQFGDILTALDSFLLKDKQLTKNLLEALCADHPDSVALQVLAGWTLNPPESTTCFEKAVELSPENSWVHTVYGNHLLQNRKHQLAAEQFQLVVDQDPNHLFASHGLLAALVLSDPASAEKRAREFTKRWPENPALYFEYSKALRGLKKHDQELPVIRKAIDLCKDVPFQYRRYLADALKANACYEEADETYRILLQSHECRNCWAAYAALLKKMGPEKAAEEEHARARIESLESDTETASTNSMPSPRTLQTDKDRKK